MVVELKLVVFVATLLLLGAVLVGIWIERRFLAPPRPTLGGEPLELDAALAEAPVGLVLLRGDRYEYANAEARRLLGLDEASGALPDAPWRAALAEDAARLTDGSASRRLLRLGAERHGKWRLARLDDERSLLFLADAGDQLRLERTSQLFLSALSHELRTPLTAILAHVELLDGATTAQASSIAFIRRETQRIVRLVGDLLELSRLNAAVELALRPTDPLIVAEEAVAAVILAAEERGVEVELEAASPQPRVLADGDRLKQVFLNLLDNAVKYAGPGDRVTVRLAPESDRLACEVRDTGPGIAAEHLPHVRERLYRGRRDVDGSGLGLALVDEVLRLHGASLAIESQTEGPERGTRVRFALPLAEGTGRLESGARVIPSGARNLDRG